MSRSEHRYASSRFACGIEDAWGDSMGRLKIVPCGFESMVDENENGYWKR